MHKSHPEFGNQPSDSEKIWRYMDLWKFINLLDEQALWFSRLDILRQKEDCLEGTISKKTIENTRKFLRENYYNSDNGVVQEIKANEQWSKCLLVNCWSRGEDKDLYKWNKYIKNLRCGIVIQTTYDKFKKSFSVDSHNIYSANVNYIDFEKNAQTKVVPPFRTVLYKNISYIWEQEVRAVINIGDAYQGEEFGCTKNITGNGTYIKVNLDELINKIYISPKTASSFIKTINNLLDRYKIYKEV